jgi:carboxylesterase type B
MHLIANGGRNDGLFVGALGESIFFPTQLQVPQLEFQFDQFANATGCLDADDQLACMRSKDSTTLQTANIARPYPGRPGAPLFPYTPCIDGGLIEDFPTRMLEQGRFIKVLILFGDDTDEGTDFAVNASNTGQISTFFQNNYPQLSTAETDQINAQYPLSENPPLNEHALFFGAAQAAYGEATFTCPGILISQAFTQRFRAQDVWNYR